MGDDFISDTLGEFLQLDDEMKPYLREKYDIKIFCSNSLSLNKSAIARIHNNLITVIEEEILLPKAIIILLEADIIKSVRYGKSGISEIFGQLIKSLAVGLHRLVLQHKDVLPIHSKKFNYPSILWVESPHHMNFLDIWNIHRKKFNKCMETVLSLYPEMFILELVKAWDYHDSSFSKDNKDNS